MESSHKNIVHERERSDKLAAQMLLIKVTIETKKYPAESNRVSSDHRQLLSFFEMILIGVFFYFFHFDMGGGEALYPLSYRYWGY